MDYQAHCIVNHFSNNPIIKLYRQSCNIIENCERLSKTAINFSVCFSTHIYINWEVKWYLSTKAHHCGGCCNNNCVLIANDILGQSYTCISSWYRSNLKCKIFNFEKFHSFFIDTELHCSSMLLLSVSYITCNYLDAIFYLLFT